MKLITSEISKKIKIYVLVLTGVAFVVMAIGGRMQVYNREHHGVVTTGLIIERGSSGKTNHYIKYSFQIDSLQYFGSMPVSFCKGCGEDCCGVGKIVQVRYEKGNPENNDLIH